MSNVYATQQSTSDMLDQFTETKKKSDQPYKQNAEDNLYLGRSLKASSPVHSEFTSSENENSVRIARLNTDVKKRKLSKKVRQRKRLPRTSNLKRLNNNARERNRMHTFNKALYDLKASIPNQYFEQVQYSRKPDTKLGILLAAKTMIDCLSLEKNDFHRESSSPPCAPEEIEKESSSSDRESYLPITDIIDKEQYERYIPRTTDSHKKTELTSYEQVLINWKK